MGLPVTFNLDNSNPQLGDYRVPAGTDWSQTFTYYQNVQLVTLPGSLTGGTFKLNVVMPAGLVGGGLTAAIAYNAANTAVATALANVPGVGGGNVAVAGSAGGPYTVSWGGALLGVAMPLLTYDASLLVPLGAITIAYVAKDITGYQAAFQIRATADSPVATWAASSAAGGGIALGGANGQIVVSAPASITGTWNWTTAVYGLVLWDNSGNRINFATGNIATIPQVVR